MRPSFCLATVLILAGSSALAQEAPKEPTHADTLRGSITPGARLVGRRPSTTCTSASTRPTAASSGSNGITYRVLRPRQRDADRPAGAARGRQHRAGRPARSSTGATATRSSSTLAAPQRAGERSRRSPSTTTASRASAKRPPWDGGFIWSADSLGNRWIATAAEGLGASVWWPNKDYPGRRARQPAHRHHRARPDDRRLQRPAPRSTTHNGDGTTTYEWFVADPINNYDVAVNAGRLRATSATRSTARAGVLTLDFWPLAYHLDAARGSSRRPSRCWRASSTGSARIPGTRTATSWSRRRTSAWSTRAPSPTATTSINGYLGRDLSGTGQGLEWDFIIVHESAHEWWGNSITAQDLRRHVGARELRQLRRGAVHRVPAGQDGGRGVHHRQPRSGIRNDRADHPGATA